MSQNPYILLTPGPLTTSSTVKEAMMHDWCTWDEDYNSIVQKIRKKLVSLATRHAGYTSVLMQGSGTFCVESVINTALNDKSHLLVLTNGAYGKRICSMAQRMNVRLTEFSCAEKARHNLDRLEEYLSQAESITHVAMVHCETTTGILNDLEGISKVVKMYNKTFIVDAMSSFGGIPFDVGGQKIDFMISSANKCIQGVPGFGFVVAGKELLAECKNNSRSLSLDLYDQWKTMEEGNGKWRFTSPTHTVRAFEQALIELAEEGGIGARYQRYKENHKVLTEGMENLGFECLLRKELQSPVITSFKYPDNEHFDFNRFYQLLKEKGFVIYPGKISKENTFRIGTIGHVFPEDINRLIDKISESMFWNKIQTTVK